MELEETWNRRNELVKLELPLLTAMIQPALPGKTVVAAEVLTAGHSNTNYKLYISGLTENFVLRFYIRDATACQKEYNLFKYLQFQIPLAEIVYSEPTGAIFGRPYSIARWVDGLLLDQLLSSPDDGLISQIGQVVGATLATIGQACSFGQPGFFDQQLKLVYPFPDIAVSWQLYIQKCLDSAVVSQKIGRQLTAHLSQFVDRRVSFLENLPVTAGLVHADFKGQNILLQAKAAKCSVGAVLDWEFAYSGSPLADFATILRHKQRFNPVFEIALAQGFSENGGALPANWQQLARLLDLINLADFLTSPICSGSMLEDVIQLIKTTVQEY